MNLNAPLTTFKGVGPQMARRLERLGLSTVQDALFHLPHRYQDRTRVHPMGTLRPGDEVVVEGEVQASDIHFGKRRALLVRISDGSGSMMLRFFHFNAAQKSAMARGVRLRCFGEVRQGPAMLEMVHPEYQRLAEGGLMAVDEHLTPVYPATEGVSQKTLRRVAGQALAALDRGLEDYLPPECIETMPSLNEALRYVHTPPPDAAVDVLQEGVHPAQQRLAFEELLAHNLSLREIRLKMQEQAAPVLKGRGDLCQRLLDSLPFELTGAQRRVLTEVNSDLAQAHPMQRLVQGDVGSGKTIVAAAAVLRAVESGYQTAVMAPTELLAEQHLRNFKTWLEPLGVEVVWLVGKQGVKAKRESLAAIADGAAVAVGTHALFQDEVVFRKLGLVVVDEQHRFGVHQRLALKEKGAQHGLTPHQLIMTATPIPRTLAMTAYADLDTSVIDELPPGRKPVETVVVADSRRLEVIERVKVACGQGRQAYWVCTLIEESEVLQCQAAEDAAVVLHEALPGVRVGLVHGRMKSAEKEAVMAAFKAAELDLLVATTVIEVGVDVPNASLMIIENAERLGLAQLHQLRGRVGRGSASSSCVLMYHKPLSQQGRTRLQAMRETNDGFEIARRDLEIRGPGEVLGTRQSGLLRLRVADLQRDQALIPAVAEVARQILGRWPDRVPKLIARWVGDAQRYGEV
ncbi:MAG TPA: ATP-dependent DNA helicase RecG [Candidatus Tenderia sp.]|nr:ATP-dependent DNA helicase RecG [Candidatus Tenderia sp.]